MDTGHNRKELSEVIAAIEEQLSSLPEIKNLDDLREAWKKLLERYNVLSVIVSEVVKMAEGGNQYAMKLAVDINPRYQQVSSEIKRFAGAISEICSEAERLLSTDTRDLPVM